MSDHSSSSSSCEGFIALVVDGVEESAEVLALRGKERIFTQ